MIDDIYVCKQLRQKLGRCCFSFVCYSEKCFIQIYRAVCGDAKLVPLGRAQTWLPESNGNICRWVLALKRNLITLECPRVEINISSSARIVQLAKSKAITHFFFTHTTSFSGSHFSHATQRLGNSNVPYYKTKNPVVLKSCKTPSSHKVYSLMKLKPQKERQFILILEYGYVT